MTTGAASRLVALYPAAWRARYGDEFAELLAAQPLTLRLVANVVVGAVDAHLHRAPAAAAGGHGGTMTSRLMARCATGGTALTRQEAWRATGVLIGSSLAFAGLHIWASMIFGDHELVDAFGAMTFPAAMLVSTPFMYMKGASRRAKTVVVGGMAVFFAVITYVSILI
jgi:hypothetical protein